MQKLMRRSSFHSPSVCYNFARSHSSLGNNVTPAMAAGVSDHVWTLQEIAALLD